jgi:hypothetical protein
MKNYGAYLSMLVLIPSSKLWRATTSSLATNYEFLEGQRGEFGGLHFIVNAKIIVQPTSLKYQSKKISKKILGNYQTYIENIFEAKEKS